MAYDGRIKLEALRDQFETFGKGANYLLVGHSAGLVGCLSIVKDHPDSASSRSSDMGSFMAGRSGWSQHYTASAAPQSEQLRLFLVGFFKC